jgi:hypothetical protein
MGQQETRYEGTSAADGSLVFVRKDMEPRKRKERRSAADSKDRGARS